MAQSLAHLFIERVAKTPNSVAVKFKEHRGPYRDMSWADFGSLVETMAAGLAALGVKPGDCGAVMANTSHYWSASDLAILRAGGVSAPIYPTSSSSDIEHILNNSGAKVVFVHNETLLNRVLAVRDKTQNVRKIILLTSPAKGRSLADLPVEKDLVLGLEELLQLGRTFKSENPKYLEEKLANIQRQDLATIIYTSGTTGTPKGVELTHDNIQSVIEDLPDLIPVNEDDTYLSFLPLSHVFERVCGEYFWLQNGATTAYAEGIEHVGKNMGEISPSIMLVVPRILDKIYAKVNAGIQGASDSKRKLIEWALGVGKEFDRAKNEGRAAGILLKLQHKLATKLVLSKLKEKIGPRLRLIVSGGAPATAEVIQFFNAVGITVIEGYGLTETAAPTNCNRTQKNKYGTVGPTLPSVEVRIAEDGEVLFRGPTIFKGYHKAPDMTAEVFSEGNWFHTGDIGTVDKDGYLKITDRKKDIIVNSSGKNIAPQKIETILKTIALLSQVVVFGDKRKTLVALLALDEQATTEFAREAGWTFKDYHELLTLPELRKHLAKEIDEKCKPLADYERVRNFAILTQELSVEAGELTATLKIKRNVVKNKYKDLIESLYKKEEQLVSR